MSDSLPNLQVRIFGLRSVKGQEYALYPVEAELDDGSRFRGSLDPMALPLNADDLAQYGLALFNALFRGGIRDAYNQAVGRSPRDGAGKVRLRLWIEDAAAELHAIPWERLYYEFDGATRPLAAGDPALYFSRYLGLQRPETPPLDLTNGPLRILFAISNPKTLPAGLQNTQVDDEVNAILTALGDLEERRQIAVTFLTGCTPLSPNMQARLETYVMERDGCRIEPGPTTFGRFSGLLAQHDIVHFLGHGRFVRENPTGPGTAALYFEDETCGYARVLDQQIVQFLQTIDPKPSLIFLAACESGVTRATEEHPYVGLAPQLIAAGVPAVVAMQDVVSMDSARQLTARFYRGLLDHGVLDKAMHEARTALLAPTADAAKPEWSTPVLLMRLQEGMLFSGTAHEVLERMRRSFEMRLFRSNEYLDLPMEAIYLTGQQLMANLDRLPPDPVAATDLMATMGSVFKRASRAADKPRLALLLGRPGANKTTQLQRIAWERIHTSLGRKDAGNASKESPLPTVIPIYVPLSRFDEMSATEATRLEALIMEILRPYWPDLTQFPETRPVLRFLFDDDGSLTDEAFHEVLDEIEKLVKRYPLHQYVLAASPDAYDWERLRVENPDIELHVLLLQPLQRRRIRYLLSVDTGARGDQNTRLLEAMNQSELYDVTQTPSFLVQIIEDARRGRYPASRCEAVGALLEKRIQKIAPGYDTWAQTKATLDRLAHEMKRSGGETLPLDAAFAIMAEERGRRGYDLESFYGGMLKNGVLAWAGKEAVKFNYTSIRDYCCATAIFESPRRERYWRDIIATLGVAEWLRWWEEVLIFLSGLLVSEPAELRRLLEALTYGQDPLMGEQIFVVARCLMEARQHASISGPTAIAAVEALLADFRPHLINALRWRADPAINPDWEQRAEAVRLLGAAGGAEAIVDLTRIAVGRPRAGAEPPPTQQEANRARQAAATQPSRRGRARPGWKHEISGVRMTAAAWLGRQDPDAIADALRAADPPIGEQIPEWRDDPEALIAKLTGMVTEWRNRDVEALKRRFQEEGESLSGLAAIALGDLQSQVAQDVRPSAEDAREAGLLMKFLVDEFLKPDKPESVGWAVTEALLLLDTLTVMRIIRPALEQKERKLQQDWYLAYLIGALRPQPGRDPETYQALHEFLIKCLDRDFKLAGIAVDALAALRDQKDETYLLAIATGGPDMSVNTRSAYITLLRRKAIEALRNVGTLDTVRQLRQSGVDRTPELRDAFYESSRAIYWKNNAPSQ